MAARNITQPQDGITIVGPGRVGQAMGKLLAASGVRVRYVAARRLEKARRAARFIGSGRAVPFPSAEVAGARTILLAVSDAGLAPAARELARLRRSWAGYVVLHTCGSLPGSGPGSPLGPLRRLRAATGCLHPFQTVPNPKAGAASLVGSFWGIDGDRAAARVARRWVRRLRGVAFRVRSNQKTLYHASAFLVSPALVTLLDQSERMLKLAGVPSRVARPMLARFAEETGRNYAEMGARQALSGPAARGDWGTLRRHLKALRQRSPGAVPIYLTLARAMLPLSRRRPPRGLLA